MNSVVTVGQGGESEKEFQEKVMARMRQAMGELLPDDVLAKIVQNGVQQAFFAPRVTVEESPYRSWERRTTTQEPWAVEFIRKELADRVGEAVRAWVAANPEAFAECVRGVMEKGVVAANMAAFEQMMKPSLATLSQNVAEAVASVQQSTKSG